MFSYTNIAAIRLVLDRQNRLVGAPPGGASDPDQSYRMAPAFIVI
jgi:hypothetical protein